MLAEIGRNFSRSRTDRHHSFQADRTGETYIFAGYQNSQDAFAFKSMNQQHITIDAIWPDDRIEYQAARKYLWHHVMAPLAKFYGKTIESPVVAQPMLSTSFGRSEKLFSRICRRRSIEFWLPL